MPSSCKVEDTRGRSWRWTKQPRQSATFGGCLRSRYLLPPAQLDLETDDVLLVSNFTDLEARLREVAFQLCSPAVTFTKKVDGVATSGWDFVGSVTVASGTFYLGFATTSPVSHHRPKHRHYGLRRDGDIPMGAGRLPSIRLLSSTKFFNLTYQFISASCLRKTLTASGIDETPFNPGNVTTAQTISVGPNDIITCEVNNAFVPDPSLSIEKVLTSANPDPVVLGSVLTYTVTATNTGNVTLNNVVVSDNDLPLDPASNTCASVAVGDTCVLVGTYTVTQADVDAGEVVNTATADSDETDPVTDDDDHADRPDPGARRSRRCSPVPTPIRSCSAAC